MRWLIVVLSFLLPCSAQAITFGGDQTLEIDYDFSSISFAVPENVTYLFFGAAPAGWEFVVATPQLQYIMSSGSPNPSSGFGGFGNSYDSNSLPLTQLIVAGTPEGFDLTLAEAIVGTDSSCLSQPVNNAMCSTLYGTISSSSILGPAVLVETGPVPEPSTWAMLLIGFVAIGGALYRRSKVLT